MEKDISQWIGKQINFQFTTWNGEFPLQQVLNVVKRNQNTICSELEVHT